VGLRTTERESRLLAERTIGRELYLERKEGGRARDHASMGASLHTCGLEPTTVLLGLMIWARAV
jgi:hypothetical protein